MLSLSGWTLISINAVMCLPLIFGMLMALASLLFPIGISVAVAAAAVVTNFVLMLTGNSVLSLSAVVEQNIGVFVTHAVDIAQTLTLRMSVGAGAVLSLLVAIVVLVLEILAFAPKKTHKPIDRSDFDF